MTLKCAYGWSYHQWMIKWIIFVTIAYRVKAIDASWSTHFIIAWKMSFWWANAMVYHHKAYFFFSTLKIFTAFKFQGQKRPVMIIATEQQFFNFSGTQCICFCFVKFAVTHFEMKSLHHCHFIIIKTINTVLRTIEVAYDFLFCNFLWTKCCGMRFDHTYVRE